METRPLARRLFLAGVLAALTLPVACARPAARHRGHTYTVRGQVTQIPDHPGGPLTLAHEAVDDFVDREGKTVGMDPMTMPFPVAPGVSLAGIRPGDVVELDLHVDWQAEPAVAITRVRQLPAGTRLVFRAAEPGKGRDGKKK